MSETTFDTIVLGGGVIGCAIAYALSKNGQKVAVLERKTIASGASGVSAAMLEAQLDFHRGEPFVSLALESRALFPPLWRELRELTGIDFQYERCGILRLAAGAAERRELLRQRDLQIKAGLAADWLEPRELQKAFPQLADGSSGAIFYAHDGQVNAARLTTALVEGARRHGARILENTALTSFERSGTAVTGVDTPAGRFHAVHTVIAAGAWSKALGNLLDLAIPVEPVRGQLVVFKAARNILPCPVFRGLRYLAPKADGFLLAGTTTERAGFKEHTTEEAVRTITQESVGLLPALASKPVRGATAGLRPHSPDELPILGPVQGVPGLCLATGHYRNGVLLAPVTARIISQLILGRPSPRALDPYLLGRFQSKT